MNTQMRSRGAGFSLVELLVTVVLAGIIFAAMVPVFVNALEKSSADNARIAATNIAQSRIEAIRMLPFSDITQTNLTSPPTGFGDGAFGPSITPLGSKKPYNITYTVDPQTKYTAVSVNVAWPETTSKGKSITHTTTMKTIVMNPAAGTTTSGSSTPTPSPSSTTGYYTLTVTVKVSDVTSSGVTVVRTDITPNVGQIPDHQIPTKTTPVTWTMLAGGPNVHYLVTCYSKPGSKVVTNTADVNLTSNYTLYFDTDPGNIWTGN